MQAGLWTGGLEPEQDLVFPGRPDDPEMRESVSLWFVADDGSFAAPRIGIEAEAASWDNRRYQGNFALAGGRVLVGPGMGAPPPALDEQGRPTIIGAGPQTWRCLEPFRRWHVLWDGTAVDGDVRDQIAGTLDPGRRTPIRLELELEMAAPPWAQVVEEGGDLAMGVGYRFEQLCRGRGTVEIAGQRREVVGRGLRIHRQSKRSMEGFRGHCWQSALFDDGRGFGYIAYPPGGDGPQQNEGYIWDGERMIPARVVEAPWLRRIVPEGDDVSLVLESELGLTRIGGRTVLSTFRVGNPDIGGLNLQQTGAVYDWDGQRAHGMLERSAHESLTTIG